MVSTSTDAVSQAAAVLALLLLTGTLLANPGYSAPTDARMSGRPWHEPCGTNKEDTGITLAPHVRHPAMKAVKRVRTQIRIAHNHYKKEMANVNMLYAEVKKVLKGENFNYSWLPKQQLSWYRTEARCLEKNTRIAVMLPALHTALQRYLVTFEQLNSFPVSIQDPQDVAKIKKRVLDEMAKQLKKVLCEVETALVSWNLPPPTPASETIIDQNLWDPAPDHTTSLIQTWGVLASYKKFLQEWQKIFQEAMKKSPPECKPGGKRNTSPTPRTTPKRKPPHGGKPLSSKTTSSKTSVGKPDSGVVPKNGPKRKPLAPKHKKLT